jgi:hypothetical protein
LAVLLSAAKGYRPLYELLEAEIRKVLPGVEIAAKSRHISLGHPREFAQVTVGPRELRLFLDLDPGARAFDARLKKPPHKGSNKATGSGPSHMLVLTDARQVNDDLMRLITEASLRANP